MIAAVHIAAPARAEPSARIAVEGACPSPAQVRAAFAAEGIALVDGARAEWDVTVASTVEGTARLYVTRAGRPRSDLQRTVVSTDCPAIADTFALIAGEHFRATTRAAVAAPTRASPPSATVANPREGLPENNRHPEERGAFTLGLSGGLDSGVAPSASAPFVQLDAGLRRPSGWGLRVAAGLDGTATLRSDDPGLQRTQKSARVEITRHLARGQRVWLSPALGAGLVISETLVPLLPGAPTVTRLHPTVTGSLSAGLRLAGRVSLRAEVATQVYPIADTYVSTERGQVGQSPRATLALGLGLQIDAGR